MKTGLGILLCSALALAGCLQSKPGEPTVERIVYVPIACPKPTPDPRADLYEECRAELRRCEENEEYYYQKWIGEPDKD